MAVICGMALSSESKARWAEELYVNSDLNQNEICEIVEISDKTLRDWRDKYGWEEIKKAGSITTPKIIAKINQILFDEMEKVNPDADQIVKYSKSIEYLKNKELVISDYVKMFRKFTEWLFVRNAESAKILNVHMKDFVNYIIHGRD